jgi:hypothetical protein
MVIVSQQSKKLKMFGKENASGKIVDFGLLIQ